MPSKSVFLAVAAVVIVSSAAAAVFLSQSGMANGNAPDDDYKEFDIMDKNAITVKAGEEFSITLKGNATTGYHWVATSYDGLRLVRDWYVTDDVDGPPRCGVGGKHTFVFSADETGTYNIVLDYLRQWENHPIKTETYSVTVE